MHLLPRAPVRDGVGRRDRTPPACKPPEKGTPVSLSRRQFGKAALTSDALTATGVVGFPRGAYAANTAYVFGYFTESPNQQAADYGLRPAASAVDRQDATFRVTS